MLSILLEVAWAVGIALLIVVPALADYAAYLDPPQHVTTGNLTTPSRSPGRRPVTTADEVMRIQQEAAAAIRRLDAAAAQAQADLQRAARQP
ncbi:hypothetical protein [Prescottella equi]|uniref:hypothetical protein n=1 Tax=Rhodococcus hoagii TaxID=43767 RepID=UPI003D95E614